MSDELTQDGYIKFPVPRLFVEWDCKDVICVLICACGSVSHFSSVLPNDNVECPHCKRVYHYSTKTDIEKISHAPNFRYITSYFYHDEKHVFRIVGEQNE